MPVPKVHAHQIHTATTKSTIACMQLSSVFAFIWSIHNVDCSMCVIMESRYLANASELRVLGMDNGHFKSKIICNFKLHIFQDYLFSDHINSDTATTTAKHKVNERINACRQKKICMHIAHSHMDTTMCFLKGFWFTAYLLFFAQFACLVCCRTPPNQNELLGAKVKNDSRRHKWKQWQCLFKWNSNNCHRA